MNADCDTTLMTLTSLHINTIGDTGPARAKWGFTVGALGGSMASAIGFLLFQWFI